MAKRAYVPVWFCGHCDLGEGEAYIVLRGRKQVGKVQSRPLYGTWDAVRPFAEGGQMRTGMVSRRAAADWLEAWKPKGEA